MDKQFIAVRAVGKWRDVVEKLTRAVQNFELNRTIPFVRPEKKPQREFYVFLSINGTLTRPLEQTIKQILRAAGLNTQYFLLPSDEIKTIASREEFEIRAFNTFRRRIIRERDLSDPFEAFVNNQTEIENDIALESRYQWLLAWLSAIGTGSRQTFAKACESLNLIRNFMPAQRIQRNLTLLGHLETSADGERWTICPPTLVRCPSQPEISFLCGARTPLLIDDLATKWEIEILPQPRHQSPPCIRVYCGELTEDEEIEVGEHKIFTTGCSSEKLSQILPDLQGWSEMLAKIDNVTTTNYTHEKWNGTEYEEFNDILEKNGQLVGEPGLYRLTHRGDKRRLNLYLDSERRRWLRGDWYGLCFLARYHEGNNLQAASDQSNKALMIPQQYHIPLLYERALVLTSGLLPNRIQDWLRYEDISRPILQMLEEKLDFIIEERNYA